MKVVFVMTLALAGSLAQSYSLLSGLENIFDDYSSFKNETELDEGQLQEHKCEPGHFSRTGRVPCHPCKSGTACDKAGCKSCRKCPAGAHAHEAGSHKCTACSLGTFANNTGQTDCHPCNPGHFADKTGSTYCYPCYPGYFAVEKGSPKCYPCYPGHYADKEGSTNCSACAPGYFSDKVGSITCPACDKGTYSPVNGSINCNLCTPGTFNNKTAQKVCPKCPGGYHSSEPGAVTCAECIPGTFSTGGAEDCTKCPKGKVSKIPGQTSCSNCSRGFYSDKEGQTECESCPSGLDTEYSGATSESMCTYHFCLAGYAGQPWHCKPCQPGSYSAKGNMTSCDQCDYGQYQPKFQGTRCDSCTYPQTTYGKGSTKSTDCEGPELLVKLDKNITRTVIDSKPIGFSNVTKVENRKGEWIFYSGESYQGDKVVVREGEVFTEGDGQPRTEHVLTAKSYYAVFPNVFCYLQDYAREYRGTRARDMYGTECKNSTGPGVCFSDSDIESPQCYIADGKLSPCGVPKCIWDYKSYSQDGTDYRGDVSSVNATLTSFIFKKHFNCTCQSWNDDFPTKHPDTHPGDPGMDKYGIRSVYCRNPDPEKYSKPWCYVGVGQNHDDCLTFAKNVTSSEVCPYVKKCTTEKYYTQTEGSM